MDDVLAEVAHSVNRHHLERHAGWAWDDGCFQETLREGERKLFRLIAEELKDV